MSPAISADHLSKSFFLAEKERGFWRTAGALFRKKKTRELRAVNEVSFEIAPGEFVGFLGPNGAGKTTTLKMLTGILTPTAGAARVLGREPGKREAAHLREIALVLGQKSQLWWDLPPRETFELNREIYQIPPARFAENLKKMAKTFNAESFLETPVRQLSLGQRIKSELIAALLHDPKVLFLDEPTIGLDVHAQRAVREFLRWQNQERGTTIILTSHYFEDIRELCPRALIISEGRKVFDGELKKLEARDEKELEISFVSAPAREELEKAGRLLAFEGRRARLAIPRKEAAAVLAALSGKLPVEDFSARELDAAELLGEFFKKGKD
jgi:ABC-2 type transport system ATP-binding protein